MDKKKQETIVRHKNKKRQFLGTIHKRQFLEQQKNKRQLLDNKNKKRQFLGTIHKRQFLDKNKLFSNSLETGWKDPKYKKSQRKY